MQYLFDNSSSYAEILRHVGLVDCGGNYATINRLIEKYQIDLSQINVNRQKANSERGKQQILDNNFGQNPIPLEDILNGTIKQYASHRLKERLIKAGYKEKKCEKCGLTTWLDNDIPLCLHHKDGNHDNNKLENLEILCHNCHALTNTFAGKNIGVYDIVKKKNNKKNETNKIICPICNKNYIAKTSSMCVECYNELKRKHIPQREELKENIRICNFEKVGRLYGVTGNAIRKWCKGYGLPFKTMDIKNIPDDDWINI